MAAPPRIFDSKTPQTDPAGLRTSRGSPRWPRSLVRDGSDRRLARRARTGDRRAIATIFERYQQELYGFCLGLLGEPQDAQDAVQNTMVKVLRALPGEEREIALRPWLYRIAHNEAIELRRSRRPTQALDGYLVDVQSSVTERAEQREQLEWLLKDLADLPERQRTVLVMRELSGLDFAEIGAALDTSGAVVRQSLYEARRNLEQMDRGRSMKCEAVTRVLSGADRRITRRRDIRAHLRRCPDCQRFQDAIGKREGLLSTIPIPATAAAGIGQALLGSSSGGGTVAALTGGVAKSVGTYGALKAAGTLAAVAVVGTAAIQSEMRGFPPDPPPRHAHPHALDSSSRSPSPQRVKAVLTASAESPSYRFAPAAAESPSALPNAEVADRRSLSSSTARGFAAEAAARPVDFPDQAAPSVAVPTTDFEPGSTPGEGTGLPPKSEKSSPGVEKTKNPDRAQEPEKEPGPPPKPDMKEKPEPLGQSKAPPGQARKQAKAEEPRTPPALPAPVESEPAGADAQAPPPAVGAEPKGKAKGHEKRLDLGPDRD